MKRSCAFAIVPVAFGLVVAAPATELHAAVYQFRDVARTNPNPIVFRVFSSPVVGDDGTVAFAGATGGGSIQNPTSIRVYKVRPDGSQAIVPGPAGRVALGRSGAATVLSADSIIRYAPDGTATPIVNTSGPFNAFNGFTAPRDDALGPVVFQGRLDGQTRDGIFNGPDPVANRLDNPLVQEDVVLVGLGQGNSPRFLADKPDGTGRAVYSGPDPQRDLVMDLSAFDSVYRYSENALGDVLISAVVDGVRGVFTGSDPVADRLTGVPGPRDGVLNDNGQMIIVAQSGADLYYVSADGAADRIISAGDPLFDSTFGVYTSSLFSERDQNEFNNRGEFTFYYTLGNGAAGVALITVPEPAALLPLGMAASVLLRRPRYRRRAAGACPGRE